MIHCVTVDGVNQQICIQQNHRLSGPASPFLVRVRKLREIEIRPHSEAAGGQLIADRLAGTRSLGTHRKQSLDDLFHRFGSGRIGFTQKMIELFGSRVHARKIATAAAKAIPPRTAFRNCSLPAAFLELRQGVSRLIRTRQDKGIVVILDPPEVEFGDRISIATASAVPQADHSLWWPLALTGFVVLLTEW